MWGEKKTKIVATLSDFRANEEFVRGLFEAGMDVVRINSAHVTEEGAAKIVEAGAAGKPERRGGAPGQSGDSGHSGYQRT